MSINCVGNPYNNYYLAPCMQNRQLLLPNINAVKRRRRNDKIFNAVLIGGAIITGLIAFTKPGHEFAKEFFSDQRVWVHA